MRLSSAIMGVEDRRRKRSNRGPCKKADKKAEKADNVPLFSATGKSVAEADS